MSTFLVTVLAGIVATSGMSLLMWAITRSGIAEADMIRAIGTIFTRSGKSAFTVGLVVHYIVGVVIAFAYVALISIIGYSSVAGAIGLGCLISVAHGVAFGFVLVISVAEHHPMERFRKAGMEVAVAHFAGHVVYGFLIGTVVGLTGIRFFG
ncbi:MAG: hypothetical protein IT344_00150 [Candidatus Dadabacteria bacterium]|nr:hypothetical protein [Candidatus Dadabacteria bacterium]